MKKLQQWIVSGIAAAVVATTAALAGSQNFYSQGTQVTVIDNWTFCPPATCTISVTVGLNNPAQPFGGGGGTATIKLGGTTVLTKSYGSNWSGSANASVSDQPSANYEITHQVGAGNNNATATGYASTTFTW